MDNGDAWQEMVRAALRQPDEPITPSAQGLVANAIAQGRRRLAARTSARAASACFLVALGIVFGLYQWAESEADRTADATLIDGVPWTQ